MKKLSFILLLCIAFGCSLSNNGFTNDVDVYCINMLKSSLSIILPKENLPEWLVVRINQVEIRPPSICKVHIYI